MVIYAIKMCCQFVALQDNKASVVAAVQSGEDAADTMVPNSGNMIQLHDV